MINPFEERNKAIIEMWNQGQSSGVIGKELGLSRNSVIGIVGRTRKKGIHVRDGTPVGIGGHRTRLPRTSKVNKYGVSTSTVPITMPAVAAPHLAPPPPTRALERRARDKTPTAMTAGAVPPPPAPTPPPARAPRGHDDAYSEGELRDQYLQAPNGQCKYPLPNRNQPPYEFCKNQAVENKAYCQEHYVLCVDWKSMYKVRKVETMK